MRTTLPIDFGLGIGAFVWLLVVVGHLNVAAPDMVYFWGAAALLKRGANPYEMGLIQELATINLPQIGRLTGGFFNPPHTLIFISWLAEFNFRWATVLWKILSIFLILVSLRVFCRRYANLLGKQKTLKDGLWIGIYLGSFAPVLVLLNIGQISAVSVAGVCFYLAWRDGSLLERAGAGVAISLATIKPHLVLLPLMLIAFDLVRWRRRSIPTFAAFISVAAIVPSLLYPASFQQWWFAQNVVPLTWFQPTLSGWLLATLGPDILALRFLPIVFASAFVVWLARRDFNLENKDSGTLYPFLVALPLGLFAAPYAWLYDFVVALPTGLALFLISTSARGKNNLARFNLALLFGANILMMYGPAEMQYYVWYPPLLTVQFLFAMRLSCWTGPSVSGHGEVG